jgi:myosin heavy subunit
MRQQGNGDALGTGRLVIPGDGGRAARGLSVGPDEAALARKPVKRRRLAERSAPLWLTATFFAAMWACDVQAGDLSRSGDGSVRLAQASTHDSAELQAAPDEGQQKAEMLVRELANAWRDLEVLLNLLNKTRDEQVKAKQAADKEAAELRTALQRAYEAQTRQASDQATELKTAQSSAADLRKSLQQERDRANQLEQDLTAAKREVETALAAKASDEAARFKQAAEKGSAELRQSLQHEQDKAERLANELATARARIYAFEAQAGQVSDQATELKTAESSAADLRKSLQQERDRANQLEQDLAAAKREEAALAAKASDEAARLQQAAEISTADQRKSLQQERDRASRLERDLAAAKRDVEAQTALATKAGDEAGKLKQATESSAAEQRNSLVQEWERAARLQRDLAAARRDVETQTALAASAHEETSRLKQIAEQESVDLRKALQLESDKAERLEGALALARTTKDASAVTVGQVVQDKQTEASGTTPVATVQVAVGDARAPSSPEDVADAARLVARANVLLAHGNIGSARVVLQRAADAGDAQASFLLAETYDPLILPKWGTFGTRGDVAKALDLYAKAQAGGIEEAKERSDALRR